jgi:predicted metal-dependent HD superfamily phosphohydrolase
MKLQTTFLECCGKYTDNARLRDQLWRELVRCYSESGRRYHTLEHLEHLLSSLRPVREHIHDWDAVLFAVYYHDIVYVPQGRKNEAQSAEIATARLGEIAFPPERTLKVARMILATEQHMASEDSDCNYFTDADLSSLGVSRETYRAQAKRIREEFAMYPDAAYRAGRQHFIQHILAMPRIFETAYFHERFERQARENLADELGGNRPFQAP